MSGVVKTARLSARLASNNVTRSSPRRGFRVSSRRHAAQNYTMPALSPTMTEGNIARWSIKEGDSFTTGDVILEIETDKATMDVEAQDDGILFKIMQPDGAKGIQVGARIAVLAEEGDDLSSLEVPKDESTSSEKKESAPKKEESLSQSEVPKDTPAKAEPSQPATEAKPSSKGQGGKAQKQTYPLYPSVQHLLHENGLQTSEADTIPASGPNGRLLKGDVLAHLGKISKDYPAQSSSRLEKRSHLDLSNITLAEPAVAAKPAVQKQEVAAPEISVPSETEIAVPVSLAAVIAVQKRVHETLGITLPLSTFVARASELANQALPSRKQPPTADDLFNAVLGLDQVSAPLTRGHYQPEITALSPAALAAPRRAKKADIIDILAAPRSRRAEEVRAQDLPAALGVRAGEKIFSVAAPVGEEERVMEFLERVKGALEMEPGRLVL